MRSIDEKLRDWSDVRTALPHYPSLKFVQGGLALGRGTSIARFALGTKTRQSLALDGREARILALLAAAHDRPISHRAIETIRRAGEIWRTGDKALAQIRLVHIGLPPIDERGAYRLDLAAELLEKGFSPRRLLKELGFQSMLRELEKYSPDQSRVPAGSGEESGHWTSGSAGNPGAGSASENSLRHRIFVQRLEVKVVGAIRSDANPDYLVPGAQYAQLSEPPIITDAAVGEILKKHGASVDTRSSKFTAEYSTEQAIRDLIEEAWKNATAEDIAASYEGRAVIGGQVNWKNPDTGEIIPHIIGISGTKFKTPSLPTNAYVVIIDANNYVVSCYPINPADNVNPRED